jgi:hypothetical protein
VSWRHIESFYVHYLLGLLCGDVLGHTGDAAAGDGHVHGPVDVVGRVYHVPALQQQVKASHLPVG